MMRRLRRQEGVQKAAAVPTARRCLLRRSRSGELWPEEVAALEVGKVQRQPHQPAMGELWCEQRRPFDVAVAVNPPLRCSLNTDFECRTFSCAYNSFEDSGMVFVPVCGCFFFFFLSCAIVVEKRGE
jgi:hypothetical protein